jgi:hypothetical protein
MRLGGEGHAARVTGRDDVVERAGERCQAGRSHALAAVGTGQRRYRNWNKFGTARRRLRGRRGAATPPSRSVRQKVGCVQAPPPANPVESAVAVAVGLLTSTL